MAADGGRNDSTRAGSRAGREGSARVDAHRVVHPSYHPELIPIFMMLEGALFRKLNEKAARRNIGYDAMVRLIIREHLADYE